MESIVINSDGNEKKRCSVWDNEVPIKIVDGGAHAYIMREIDEPRDYNELYHLAIYNLTSKDTLHLHLNTPGGRIDAALQICDALKRTKAKVIVYLSGSTYSAGTLITMCADELYVAEYTDFMVHTYSTEVSGKGHEMKSRQEFSDKETSLLIHTMYKHFLTEEEIEKVIEGKDFWFNKCEVLERWERKVKHTEREKEKK